MFCFNGEPHHTQVDSGRFVTHVHNIYDINWQFLPFRNNVSYPFDANNLMPVPKNYDKMVEIAKTLSTGHPHVRVDFYNIDGNIYFGELTFFHGSGMAAFYPEEWEKRIGDLIVLPEKKRKE